MKIINLKDFASKLFNKQTTYTSLFHHTTYDLLRSNSVFDSAYNSGLIDENSEVFWVENMSPEQEKDKTMYLVFDTIFYVKEYLERYIETRHPLAKIVDTKSTYKILELRKPDPALEEIAQAISEELGKIDQQRDFKTAYDELIFSPFFFFKELACNDIGFLPSIGIDGPMRELLKAQDELNNLFDESDKYSDEPEKFQKLLKEKQKAVTISNQAVKEAMENRKAELLEELWGKAKRNAGRARRLETFEIEIRQELKSRIKDLIPLIIKADDEEFSEFITLLTLSIKRKRQDRNKPLLIPNNNLIFSLCTTNEGYLAPFASLTPKGANYKVDGRIRLTASYDETKAENIDFKELMVYTIADSLWTGRIGPLNTSDIQKRIKKNVRVRPEENKAIERILRKGEHTECVIELRKWEKKSPVYLLGPENQEDLAQFKTKENQSKKSKGYYISDEILEATQYGRTILKIDLWQKTKAKNKGESTTFWMSRPPFLGMINNAFNQFIEVRPEILYLLCDGFSFDDNAPSLPWALVPFFLRLLNYPDRKEWVFSYETLLGDRNYLNYPKEKYIGTSNIKRDNWRIIDKVGRNFEKAGLMKMITDHQSGTIRLQPLADALPEFNTDEARKRRTPSKIDNQLFTALLKSKRDTFNFFTGEEDLDHLKELPLIFLNEPKRISKNSETFEVKCKLDRKNKNISKLNELLKRKNQL